MIHVAGFFPILDIGSSERTRTLSGMRRETQETR